MVLLFILLMTNDDYNVSSCNTVDILMTVTDDLPVPVVC